MGLQVVGAGLGRTGTNSLKLALEHLLSGTCHHMFDVKTTEHMAVWEPICEGLDLPVPDTPFPQKNTKKEFWEREG